VKVLWISPEGKGFPNAEQLVKEGNKVVAYGSTAPDPIPNVPKEALWTFAKAADLVVVDGSFPLERTRRSFKPSQDALFFDELRRKYAIACLGPTPTLDLIVGDPRYLRKWCARLGLVYGPERPLEGATPWEAGAWFIGNDIVPPGPLLLPWKPIFKAVGFRGWFHLTGWVGGDGVHVTGAETTWPADSLPNDKLTEFLWRMNHNG
jgi:hypothetical protein